MERDNNVVFLGEDVAKAGGVFKATVGLYEKFGPLRVRDTPISEQAILGAAMGAAMTGLRPIAELMFSDFAAVCFDFIANEIPKLAYMTNGQLTCRLAHPGTTSTIEAATTAIATDLQADLKVLSPDAEGNNPNVVTMTVSGLGMTGAGGDSAAKHRDATVAAWAVAHSAAHGITSVTIGDREWRADRDGWRDAKTPAPGRVGGRPAWCAPGPEEPGPGFIQPAGEEASRPW